MPAPLARLCGGIFGCAIFSGCILLDLNKVCKEKNRGFPYFFLTPQKH